MEKAYPVPEHFDDYVYLTQIVQAEGIQKAFDAHNSSAPYCMGTLFWQFNDCWPSISWSTVDYYGQPKALYYFAKRSFKNISIASFMRQNEFNINIINHNNYSINTKLIISVKDFYGGEILSDSVILISDLLSSTPVLIEKHLNDSIKKHCNNAYISLKLIDINTDKLLSSRTIVTGIPLNLNLPEQNVKYQSKMDNEQWEIMLSSDVFIKDVYLISDNVEGQFSDNYFNLLPGEKKIIKFYPQVKTNKVQIRIISMNKIINDHSSEEILENPTDSIGNE